MTKRAYAIYRVSKPLLTEISNPGPTKRLIPEKKTAQNFSDSSSVKLNRLDTIFRRKCSLGLIYLITITWSERWTIASYGASSFIYTIHIFNL